MGGFVCVLVLTFLIGLTNGQGTYFISAPQFIFPGVDIHAAVNILLDNVTVPVDVSLQCYTYNASSNSEVRHTVHQVTGYFSKDSAKHITIPRLSKSAMDAIALSPDKRLHFRGRGPLQFETSLSLSTYTAPSFFIQTDKGMYKPSDTVRYRAFGIYSNLQMYSGSFFVIILDPKGDVVKHVEDLYDPSGVIEGSFHLIDQPTFGTWRIEAGIKHSKSNTVNFQVMDYDLPTFEVTVGLPPYVLKDDTHLSGTVTAKYTFGQPVKGSVELLLEENTMHSLSRCADETMRVQLTMEIDGEAKFSFTREDILRVVPIENLLNVKVTAIVTEISTGVRLNSSSTVMYHAGKYKLQFMETMPSVFKPGLTFTASMQVTTPDGRPPTEDNTNLSVYTSVSYDKTMPDQHLYAVGAFSGTYPLAPVNLTLPPSGVVHVRIDIPSNVTSIVIKATYGDVNVQRTVQKARTPSNNYLALALMDNNIMPGMQVKVKVTGTEPLHLLTYEVVSRETIVYFGTVNGNGQKEFDFLLKVTTSMAPTAHLLVYYTSGQSDVIGDCLAFMVDGMFNNKVSLSFSANQSQPRDVVQLTVTADPDSHVFVTAVDQSVLLLKSSNDVTTNQVSEALNFYSTPHTDPSYAKSESKVNAKDLFTSLNMQVDTDIPVMADQTTGQVNDDRGGYISSDVGVEKGGIILTDSKVGKGWMSIMATAESLDTSSYLENIRNVFSEVWLWSTSSSSKYGKATFVSKVPDTITSWVASAFATNYKSGLGVASTVSKLTVFKPFFVSLTHPRSVTRHEQFVLQATVYNYLQEDLTVTVTLRSTSRFKIVKIDKNGKEYFADENAQSVIQVGSNQQGVTYFPILASVAGALDLDVSAKSSMAADAVRGQVNVKLEGAPLTFNNPVYVTLNSSTSFVKSLNITFPTGVVPGSKRIRAAVTGDLLGSSLNSLSSLLTIPTGYGDTNLFMFAPNLYMAKYLNVTKQTRTSYYKEAIRGLEEGFQSLLTIKRTDGSFSRGGDGDRTGSVWLTALASRAVHEASVYIHVDSILMSMATSWLIDRQNSDGSFKEFSKNLDKTAQGSVPALTSLVMLSILENNDHTYEKTCRTTNICYFRKSMLNATSRALEFLERMVEQDALNDPYTLAVVSYGLAKSGSTKTNLVFRKLLALGVREGGLLYWRADSSDEEQQEHPSRWRPVHKQARSADVIITSYAVLTFVALGRLEEAVPAVTWLTSQRNPQGGFVSTQDTVTGLQALAEFATQSLRPDTSVSVTVDDTQTRTTFTVTQDNSLTLQTRELFESPAKILINAAGKGNALVEVATSFNIEEELLSSSFDVKVVVLDDEVNKLRMMVCTRLLSQRSAGLVVQEVGIPSGFQPDLTAVDNVAGLVKTEVKGNFLNVYLDEIGKSTLCYTLTMVRVAKVARSQKCYVKTYDYYETGNQATVFYEPQAIKEAGICDVCKGCFPYQICRLTVGDRNI